VSIATRPFAKFPQKNFVSKKKSVLSLPPMFDRVSSDTLNCGGHAECPVPASRYAVAAMRNGRGRQFECLMLDRHRPRILSKSRKRSDANSIRPSCGDLIVVPNVCW
jgi:hypothetical protein